MKLTVTNSSIDFFVPIDYVHQAKLDQLFCLHGLKALQTARQTIGDGLSSCRTPRSSLSKGAKQTGHRKTCKLNVALPPSFSKQQFPCENMVIRCVLPTWWLLRGGCTRSHSEHGRETPQRQWYSVLRRGRVGRCQVCKTQHMIKYQSSQHTLRPSRYKRAAISGLSRLKRRHAYEIKEGAPNTRPVRPLQETNPMGFAPAAYANSASLLCRDKSQRDLRW